jgi:purine/pyrimidine-nucleoside phosphorylase
MLKHNTYFDGSVQSIGFSRHGRTQTVGVIAPGDHRFGTQSAERMTIISGEMMVRRAGESAHHLYAAGSFFEVSGGAWFEVHVAEPVAYWCEYL